MGDIIVVDQNPTPEKEAKTEFTDHEIHRRHLSNIQIAQNIGERKKYGRYSSILAISWMIFLILVVIAQFVARLYGAGLHPERIYCGSYDYYRLCVRFLVFGWALPLSQGGKRRLNLTGFRRFRIASAIRRALRCPAAILWPSNKRASPAANHSKNRGLLCEFFRDHLPSALPPGHRKTARRASHVLPNLDFWEAWQLK